MTSKLSAQEKAVTECVESGRTLRVAGVEKEKMRYARLRQIR